MANANHPIWMLVRLTIVMTTLVVVLMLTASKFDESELRTILTMFIALAGLEGAGAIWFRSVNKNEDRPPTNSDDGS